MSEQPRVQYRIDHTAPQTPEGFNLEITSSNFTLTWTKGSETDLAHYQVYRAVDSDSNYIFYADQVKTVQDDDAQTAIFRDSNVEFGRTYYYKVAAVDLPETLVLATETKSGTLRRIRKRQKYSHLSGSGAP